MNFALFSYNTSIHSSTGFTPHYLTFGSEARLPPELIVGSPSFSRDGSIDSDCTSRGALTSVLQSFSVLSRAFASVRENLRSVHQREKDRYDLGAVEKVFTPGTTSG